MKLLGTKGFDYDRLLKVYSSRDSLKVLLNTLRGKIAEEAQSIYLSWEQDDEGMSEELGGGGICDQISQAILSILSEYGIEGIEGGQEGDDHSWVIAYDDNEAFGIDIPPGVYESGGGYSWKKIKEVEITPNDVVVFPIDRADLDFQEF